MAFQPADFPYYGNSRNPLFVTGFVDVNGILIDSANGAVSVSAYSGSTGSLLFGPQAMTYGGTAGSWNYILPASACPLNDTISIVITHTNVGGSTVYLTKTIPGKPIPPLYVTYGRLSEHGLSFNPQNLVGAASATATIRYRSGLATWGPNAMTGTAAPFTYPVIAAAQFPAGDVITITMIATDTLGVAATLVIVAADDGD